MALPRRVSRSHSARQICWRHLARPVCPCRSRKSNSTLKRIITNKPYCFNLIYSPNEKGHEDAIVDLYLRYGIDLVETSAYMKLTLPVVRYRVKGIS